MRSFLLISLSMSIWLFSGQAVAYIGPGAGLSAIGSLLALLGALILAIVGFIWYPVKRLMSNRKAAKQEADRASVDKEQ